MSTTCDVRFAMGYRQSSQRIIKSNADEIGCSRVLGCTFEGRGEKKKKNQGEKRKTKEGEPQIFNPFVSPDYCIYLMYIN